MSKSIHDQVMSPSCLGDCRDWGCDPRLRPFKLSLVSPGTGGIHRGNSCARLSPEPNPSQEHGSTKPALEDKVLSPPKRKEEMEAQEFLICLVEETQIPAGRRSRR